MIQVMKVTIEKKTDQLNYEDFLGGQTRIVTIAEVIRGNKEQQYDIRIEDDERVWRPAVTVLKLLVAAWTDEATTWVGHRAELYGDPTIMFGREKVGGIRVSRVSHISEPLSVMLTETRSKRRLHSVDPLPDAPPPAPVDPNAARIAELGSEWKAATPERRVEIELEVAKLKEGSDA